MNEHLVRLGIPIVFQAKSRNIKNCLHTRHLSAHLSTWWKLFHIGHVSYAYDTWFQVSSYGCDDSDLFGSVDCEWLGRVDERGAVFPGCLLAKIYYAKSFFLLDVESWLFGEVCYEKGDAKAEGHFASKADRSL